jgi:ankyrin repeat protein
MFPPQKISIIAICSLLTLLTGCGSTMSLYDAIREGDTVAIARYSKENLSAFSITNKTPLIYAMEQGKKESFLALLKSDADPNRIGSHGRNLMMLAAIEKDLYWLHTALQHGGDPNLDNHASPQRRCTPLIIAARDEHIGALKLLIEGHNADVNYVMGYDDALITAAGRSQYRAVLYFLKSGADFRRKTSPVHSFAENMRHKTTQGLLQKQDQDDLQAVIDWLAERGVAWNNPKQDGDAWVY